MSIIRPFNFKKWIDENRHLLKPPVGNKVVYENTEFIVMVVGGPNARKDYHFNESEEFFYQLEGNITVKIQEDGKAVDVPINEGDIFLLPPRVPHNPVRGVNTIGLVMERKRREGEEDGLMWFCEKCNAPLYEKKFKLTKTEPAASLPSSKRPGSKTSSWHASGKSGACQRASSMARPSAWAV